MHILVLQVPTLASTPAGQFWAFLFHSDFTSQQQLHIAVDCP